MKHATHVVAKEADKSKEKRRSTVSIVAETNLQFKSDISASTVGRHVRKGLMGVSPLKPGPVGHFPKSICDALKGSHVTHLKLEQAESKKQSTTKKLATMVNTAVNKVGF